MIKAYRVWLVSKDLKLQSWYWRQRLFGKYTWRAGDNVDLVGRGLYSVKSIGELKKQMIGIPYSRVVAGEVLVWGRVVEYEGSLTSTHLCPYALVDSKGLKMEEVKELARKYEMKVGERKRVLEVKRFWKVLAAMLTFLVLVAILEAFAAFRRLIPIESAANHPVKTLFGASCIVLLWGYSVRQVKRRRNEA